MATLMLVCLFGGIILFGIVAFVYIAATNEGDNSSTAPADSKIDKITAVKNYLKRNVLNYPDTAKFHTFGTSVSGNDVTLKVTTTMRSEHRFPSNCPKWSRHKL